MFLQKFFNKQFVQTAFAIAASVLAVAGFVYGATTIGTNVSIDGNLTVSGTTATSTFSTGGLTVGTNQFVVQQTSGNVGIGTTTPSRALSVAGVLSTTFSGGSGGTPTANVGILLDGGTTSDFQIITTPTTEARIFLGNTNSGTAGRIIYNNSTDSLRFSTVATERLRIDSSGNLGIGTTSPAQLLSVAGDAYIAGAGTTTLNLKTTTASKGTCIEMFDSGGAVRRLYINAAGAITVEAGTCK